MKMIGVQCPTCRLIEDVAASCVLLEVGTAAEDSGSSRASWICDTCRQLVALPVDLTVLIALVTAGASVLDSSAEDASPESTAPPHPETAVGGLPLTHDDLLEFHESLQNDSRLTTELSRP